MYTVMSAHQMLVQSMIQNYVISLSEVGNLAGLPPSAILPVSEQLLPVPICPIYTCIHYPGPNSEGSNPYHPLP